MDSKMDVYNYLIIPILIFLARIMDVSIGTMRIIFISRGKRLLAPILGFLEVSIWLTAISQAMKHLNNPVCFIAYGMGFATGNYVGMLIEDKLAIGMQAVRLITQKTIDMITMALRDEGFGVTVTRASGAKGEVNVILTIVPRKKVGRVIEIARDIDPDVFISIQDIREVRAGYFPQRAKQLRWRKVFKKR
ncbi:MAG: DUF2179 domain-containing protein [Candidatus Marinimicrobia bacterium]|nr:DUF2179 domain-containing protein [Candidatus Neomarinimicrobiota bacterium]MCD6099082.1 DUF2179 domain-containing protein [Candidatus Neomarinimicrobiota bacterium]HDN59872.1 DUF2179 domain-containing protein [Candidatus Neomarinimicrobiota bacterium]